MILAITTRCSALSRTFTFHYGKIDWIESNNEYWLEMDAQLRTDFNINTGAKNDFIERIKYKSKMKESYIAAGVPVARYHIVSAHWPRPAPLSRRSATRSSSSRITAAVPRRPTSCAISPS